ncbi:tRNA uridine-5-carboxymethylaminomethyl(34) synthesis GTPase MnmE [Ureaplasma canigenitalium]|uniref:tRNA uridine-5-carboxymethylaminomethyl(34) synthesis GTPase MnmE n=1 Tax=Ureaplasma canigenitalium TaxID=42092 RepID=UPI0004E0E08E|nr:tRNA uridine-5-carboxymethylaminomethyl(34) synthesis GTPase MnmE [Ureaplasma canigenitalium]
MKYNTIVALATANLNCAIHIIRISGPEAFQIINKVSSKEITKETFKIQRTQIVNKGVILDDVLIMKFVGPRTFTGEDLIEINCHGGVVVARMIIDLLLQNGCVYAQRGEFSQRAYMNGAMDLLTTEAINNLVNASNDNAVYGIASALVGKLQTPINHIKDVIFNLLGTIEVNIDYPEYDDVEHVDQNKCLNQLQLIEKDVAEIINNSKKFIPINEGIKILILGKPNVGKSTLLNALANEEKAIVTDIPGTTRDLIETIINVDGITLKIIDTAGIHETNDVIEKMGIERTLKKIDQVDIILYLIEKNETKDPNLFDLIKDKDHLIVHTKKDLITSFNQNEIYINAKDNDISPLIQKLKELFHIVDFEMKNVNALQSVRQISLLERVHFLIKESIKNLLSGATVDLIADYLQECNLKINEILGTSRNYDFLDDLFKRFCLGK